MSWWLLATTFYPIALLCIFAWRPAERYSRWWIVSAPLPALLLTVFLPDSVMQIPDILFGVVWAMDEMSRPLLMMTALLWLLSGVFALGYMKQPALRRFTLFWLMTMVGNFALILANDIASFYTGFTLMTFAGYGLVIHTMSAQALRAGRVYMAMAIMGEVLILAGFIALLPDMPQAMLSYVPIALAEHEHGLWLTLLLFAGFGVKAGVLGLHFWLPLAHPVAPTPASAVLSGAMIKAGLIAWMQVLPLGNEAASLMALSTEGRAMLSPEVFAWLVIALGLAASFFAAVLGALQLKPKAVLAYSSISQMGLMTTLLGVALLMPELWPGVLLALIAFTVHHGLAKGALFLGVGLAQHPSGLPRWAILTLLLIPALSLIGVPLTSGAAAKYLLKGEAYETELALLVFLITFAAAATTLLMLRFIDLVNGQLQITLQADARKQDTSDKMLQPDTRDSAATSSAYMNAISNESKAGISDSRQDAITDKTRAELGAGHTDDTRLKENCIKYSVLLSIAASSILVWLFPIGLSFTNTLSLTSLWEAAWPMALATAIYLTSRRFA